MKAVSLKSKDIHGILYSIASDGDLRRRLAAVKLTMKITISTNLPLWSLLGDLELINYECGENEETMDIEYKHLLKHLQNTLIRAKCTTINGVVLTLQVLKHHLLSLGIKDERGVNALLSPKDKQDVKLMYNLLTSITSLSPPSSSMPPTEHKAQGTLTLLGHLYSHFIEVYTNVDILLNDQLRYLSAAAHLAMAFYHEERGQDFPSQVIFDLMCMVKNLYCCVAKAKHDNINSKFFVILLGTDPLKHLFGCIQTIVGNDSNMDQYQLSNCIKSAIICSSILDQHPDWEHRAHQLNLKNWKDQVGDVSTKVDHISPASWCGDVSLCPISLTTAWYQGHNTAEEVLTNAGWVPPFKKMVEGEGFDMFSLFGDNQKVCIHGKQDGE